jgi:hypothetical protein
MIMVSASVVDCSCGDVPAVVIGDELAVLGSAGLSVLALEQPVSMSAAPTMSRMAGWRT